MEDNKIALKKNESAQREHIRRKARFLKAEIDCLTPNDVLVLIKACSANFEDESHVLILVSLLTGRSIDNLLKPSNQFVESLGESERPMVSLIGDVLWPVNKRSKNVSDHLVSQTNAFHTLLPGALLTSLKDLHERVNDGLEFSSKLKKLKTKVNDRLIEISEQLPRKITIGRVQSHFEYHRGVANISRVEQAVISGQSKARVSQANYIRFEHEDFTLKHGNFIRHVVGDALPALSTYENPYKGSFGSNMLPPQTEIRILFDTHLSRLLSLTKNNQYDFMAIHNVTTVMYTNLLQLVTLHRPVIGLFGTILHYDADFSWAFIRDKGDASERKIPIAQFGAMLFKGYVSYLNQLKDKTRLTWPEVHKKTLAILNGEENIFQIWSSSDALRDINPKRDYKLLFDFDYPENWHRHVGATKLYRSGTNMEFLAAYMGQEPEQDKHMYLFSTLSYNKLREVSVALNEVAKSYISNELFVFLQERANEYNC